MFDLMTSPPGATFGHVGKIEGHHHPLQGSIWDTYFMDTVKFGFIGTRAHSQGSIEL